MISRRDFLKLIGIVPIMLKMPKNLPEEPVVLPPKSDTIWCFPPLKHTEDEFLFYTGTSALSELPDSHFKWVG